MSITTVPRFLFPRFQTYEQATASPTTSMSTVMTYDATGDRCAVVGMVTKTGTVTAVEFRTGTVSTAGATFQIQLETVDGSGNPSGTPYATGASGTVVVATSDDNVFKSVSINSGSGVTVTKGDMIAIVLSVSSGTPNTVVLTGPPTVLYNIYGIFPYILTDTAGSWAKTTSGGTVSMALNYGGTYEYFDGIVPISAGNVPTVGNGNERALKLVAPAPMRVTGARAFLSNVTAGANFRICLYDSTPTLLAECLNGADFDGDHMCSATNDGWCSFNFNTEITLTSGATYYLSVYQKTANNLSLLDMQCPSNGYLNALTTQSTSTILATRSGGSGSFSDTNTTVPLIQLVCDGIDNGAGSGGAFYKPTMRIS